MAKGTVVRGTPVNHISADRGQGFNNPTLPAKYAGTTTSSQYKGAQEQQPNPKSGTPAPSRSVNDDIQKLVSAGCYGVSPGAGGQDYNSHTANGSGVVFDVARSRDLIPSPAAVMDSPVPTGAQRPDTDSAAKLNALRNGKGDAFPADKTIPDGLVGTGGTMDR